MTWTKTMDLRLLSRASDIYEAKSFGGTLQQRETRGREIAHEYPEPDSENEFEERWVDVEVIEG